MNRAGEPVRGRQVETERMMLMEKHTDMTETFRDMNILVVGLARSGTGAANLLSALGARVTVTDIKPQGLLQDSIKRLDPSVRVIAGRDAEEIFDEAGMIVISPGVPADITPLSRARGKGIPVIGELELAWRVIQRPFIAVTGTNGKSTVTTLVGLMLKESGFSAVTGGNIGNALTEEIYSGLRVGGSGCRGADYIVAEVSSFQLESAETFRPKIAAILNITPDHLDRYGDMEDYINAKARIFGNQTPEDFLVLNADDPEVQRLESERLRAGGRGPRIFHFSRQREVEGVYCRDGKVWCNLRRAGLHKEASPNFPLASVDGIRIKGAHNLENAMAASLCALLAGCSHEAVRGVLESFPGLEHRLEPVAEINGVRFINDSKGTNTGAVAGSLKGLDTKLSHRLDFGIPGHFIQTDDGQLGKCGRRDLLQAGPHLRAAQDHRRITGRHHVFQPLGQGPRDRFGNLRREFDDQPTLAVFLQQ